MAGTVTWSLLIFLHFRCPSPSGGSRKVKYPNAWGGGGGTGQGTRCCRESRSAGRRACGARAAHLHFAHCIFSAWPGKKQSTALQAAYCEALLPGDPGLNTLNRLCTRVRKHPPTALGSGTWKRSGPGWSPTLQKDCLNLRPF